MLEITEIPVPLDRGATEEGCLDAAHAEAVRLLGCQPYDIHELTLRRKSVDARRKRQVQFVVNVRVQLRQGLDERIVLDGLPQQNRRRVRLVSEVETGWPERSAAAGARTDRPVVVGAGCAGLFCALALAEAGLEPLLIERGQDARRRSTDIADFKALGLLKPDSNIQFGLGGAGTFSDGKLSTGTKSPDHRLILQTFVEAGAPEDILWEAKPHIGSDILPGVVENLVQRIRERGGEVRFGCKLIRLDRGIDSGVRDIAVTTDGFEEYIFVKHLVLACGHSARDVFALLQEKNVRLARKTFAMGVRIEHLQADIDAAQYGASAGHPALGAASYNLVTHCANGRSLFSFCMCPGGEVVAAATEPDGVVTNGASLNARAGANANAALLVNINPEDLPGTDPLAGIELQRQCERRAFELGGGAHRAPVQLVGDFLAGRPSEEAGRIQPTYPRGTTWSELDETLPPHVIETLRAGLPALDRKLRGFNDPEAVLTGVETRSSSPVQIVRGKDLQAEGTPGLYPCGEGAGYAGGIMSAATDGLRVARAVIADIAAR